MTRKGDAAASVPERTETEAASDAFWLGTFVMVSARAAGWIKAGRPRMALEELTAVLERFSESALMDDSLRQELAPYWPARGED